MKNFTRQHIKLLFFIGSIVLPANNINSIPDNIPTNEALLDAIKQRCGVMNDPTREKRDAANEKVKSITQTPNINANIPDRTENYPLHMAVRTQDPYLVNILLGIDTINVNCSDKHGNTPLHLAASKRDEFKGLTRISTPDSEQYHETKPAMA